MNLKEWEQNNKRLVNRMESFYFQYQKKHSCEFDKDWVRTNKCMCEVAARKFKKEIKNQINKISPIR